MPTASSVPALSNLLPAWGLTHFCHVDLPVMTHPISPHGSKIGKWHKWAFCLSWGRTIFPYQSEWKQIASLSGKLLIPHTPPTAAGSLVPREPYSEKLLIVRANMLEGREGNGTISESLIFNELSWALCLQARGALVSTLLIKTLGAQCLNDCQSHWTVLK